MGAEVWTSRSAATRARARPRGARDWGGWGGAPEGRWGARKGGDVKRRMWKGGTWKRGSWKRGSWRGAAGDGGARGRWRGAWRWDVEVPMSRRQAQGARRDAGTLKGREDAGGAQWLQPGALWGPARWPAARVRLVSPHLGQRGRARGWPRDGAAAGRVPRRSLAPPPLAPGSGRPESGRDAGTCGSGSGSPPWGRVVAAAAEEGGRRQSPHCPDRRQWPSRLE